MQNVPLREAEKYISQNQRRRIWRRIVRVMACIVVFCTTYALILPAITLEKVQCDLQEHTHSESCYKKIDAESVAVLACTYESLGVHVHTSECYDSGNHLICGQADFVVHVHDGACVDASGVLACRIPEIPEHEHTDSCYAIEEAELTHVHEDACYGTERGELICKTAETDGHTHGQSCFTQGTLVCQIPEQEGHTHGEDCSETVLVCDLTVEPHVHGEGCYQQLVCDIPEGEDHTHTEECSGAVLICDLTEQLHIHTDGCYETHFLCDLPETEGHTHGTDCYESIMTCELSEEPAHQHTDECYEMVSVLVCGLEEGTASSAEAETQESVEPELICGKQEIRLHCHDSVLCYAGSAEEGSLICTELAISEHIHDESCYVTEEVALEDVDTLTCTLMEGHVHAEECYDEAGTLICTETENHVHGDMCYGTWVLICGKEEHAHTEACINLTAEELAQVEAVIALIDTMPSSEQIDEQMMELESAGDLTGLDAYFAEVSAQVCTIYEQYELLTDDQKACVTNADKLLALEYMWANQEDASAYAAEITGYNLNANNIFSIDGFLGTEAAYRYDGTTLGTYNSAAKDILDKANVIYVDLPVNANGDRCSLGNYLLGKNHASLLTAGGIQGTYGVDLNAEWCALRVEEADTEYPGYLVKQVVYKDRDVTRIGRLSVTSDAGFILLIRSSFIENNNLYIPGEEKAYLHLNKELLHKIKGWTSFESDPGYLPSSFSSSANYVPLAYVTLSPVAQYDEDGKRIGDSGARVDDMPVVSGIKFKLFDYSEYINKVDRTETDSDAVGTIHSKYRALAKYFYFRGGFEFAGKDYGLDVARYTPNVNTVEQDGAGHKLYDQDGYTVNHARVEPNLWNGYPILDFTKDAKGNAIAAPSGWGTGEKLNARSLRFLFDQDYAYSYDWTDVHKIATGAVTEYSPTNTILQFNPNTHTYWYDSAKHAVDYDINARKFRVRKYTERTSITADWPFDISAGSGDFLPFNYSDGIVNATYHSGSQPGVNPVADSSFRMNDVNYWFGMSMEFSFIQGKDGTVTYTNTSGERKTDPMVFEFSGDDDVWVFIDGVRVLDLGGTHGSVTGIIDFTTGKVTQELTWGKDPNKSYPTTLKECFALAGKTPKGGWDDNGERFADYSVHTLKFFYLERGTAVANCSIRFNLPNFDTPLVVGKTLNPADETVNSEVLEYLRGNTEYSYRALETDKNGNILKDEDGNPVLFMRRVSNTP